MSRLIDADEWIKKLNAIIADEEAPGNVKDYAMFLISEISAEPTAYDVEKVVAELENASHWEEPTFDEDGYCNDDSWEVVYLDKATEIVRKGGIE